MAFWQSGTRRASPPYRTWTKGPFLVAVWHVSTHIYTVILSVSGKSPSNRWLTVTWPEILMNLERQTFHSVNTCGRTYSEHIYIGSSMLLAKVPDQTDSAGVWVFLEQEVEKHICSLYLSVKVWGQRCNRSSSLNCPESCYVKGLLLRIKAVSLQDQLLAFRFTLKKKWPLTKSVICDYISRVKCFLRSAEVNS